VAFGQLLKLLLGAVKNAHAPSFRSVTVESP
jgi:hypothetical protein